MWPVRSPVPDVVFICAEIGVVPAQPVDATAANRLLGKPVTENPVSQAESSSLSYRFR
jgi:hypothetical protein